MTISRLLATLATGTLLVVSPAHVASVLQSPAERIVDRFCELIALPFDSFTTVPAPVEMLDGRMRPEAVAINVTYGPGFAAFPQAQAAFQYAVNIWRTQVTSSVPVTVQADFSNLVSNVLGSARFVDLFANFAGAPITNVWFPGPIANAITNSILAPAPQVSASFNRNFTWYFGTDGLTPPGQHDFVTVVLHELGHGLGFAGSLNVSAGLGSWGQSSGFPFIYDRFVANGSDQSLTNTGNFANNSGALAAQLTSNNVFWNGSQGVAANGGVKPRLYAPNPFEGGSSIFHLDDATFPAGNANSLMTHAIGSAEAIHSPGAIVRGIFTDSGWTLDTGCTYILSAAAFTMGQSGGVGTVGVTTTAGCPWTATSNAPSFITVTGGASVTGSGVVSYTVAANTGTQRSGTITIAGQTFTLTQSAAPACTYTLSATAFTIGDGGGSGTVGVTTTAGCPWTATTTASFITIADGTNRTGSGILNYSTAANTGAQRSGTITIAGQTFTLTQSAAPPACTYTLSSTAFAIGQAGGLGTVGVTTASSCPWAASSNSAFMTVTGGASGTGSGIVTYSTTANSGALRTGTLTIAGQTFTLTQGPVMSANRASLAFAATNSGGTLSNITATQSVTVTFAGGSPAWRAGTIMPWLQVSGGGTGNGTFTVSVVSAAGLPATGTVTGSVIVTSAGASNSQAVTVTLTLFASPTTSAAPFGAFDTPAAGASVEGSIAVTGWALDDIEVVRVEIWRDLVAGETTPPFAGAGPGNGKVFIANAFFVNGARPDIETAYSTLPYAYRGGWGYLLLTQGLWNQGNGPFTLYAFAYDKEGRSSTLGTKAITVNNAAATRPFGGIDVPSYGQTMTGSFYNFGWALTPKVPPTCTIGPTQVQMAIDSGTLVPVTYGDLRTDIAGAFPGFSNGNSAGGAALVDTTTLTNGTHSIGWFVTDSCGRAEGIGSRFFTVLNGAAGSTAAGSTAADSTAADSTAADSTAADSATPGSPKSQAPSPKPAATGVTTDAPIDVRRGLDTTLVYPSASGTRLVTIGQGERVEVVLPPAGGATYAGYQVVKGERRPLPMGSSLDAAQGIFYWQPAAGFLGAHDLEFASSGGDVVRVRAVVGTSVQAVIDTPQPVSSRFTIAGWAIDQAATTGTGIDTVHVWAYPLTGAGPIFLGVAAYGDARPDIGAMFGEQFASSSFSLVVDSLVSGAYDLVVYPHSAVTGDFRGAQVVRVVVPR